MGDFLLNHEPTIRLITFLTVLISMMVWEVATPRRRQEIPKVLRWTNNLSLVVIDTAILRLAFPVLAVGLAGSAKINGWGLFNMIDLPLWVAVIFAIMLLDLATYVQHIVFHAVPGLWRLHRMHHADLEFDATTGLRFHPAEIVLSMTVKLALVLAIGAPAVAVLAFEVILNAASIFNHSNIAMSPAVDRVVRLFLVTPDMHRVHHSIEPRETNANFGFSVPWWDRLFGTYLAQPAKGHLEMKIGIEQFRSRRELWLDRMLVQPLREIAESKAKREQSVPKKTK
jgi:sterol desaturase/sphingolipid hydroxylase (fatty acid hydroxylase superfamily)